MADRSARRGRATLAAVAATLLLTGCTGLPDSGPAGAGVAINDSSVEPLQAAPQGPRPDAGPAEIVGGFLRAGAGFDNDHAVARGFLVGDAVRSWRPSRGTVVYADDTSLSVLEHADGPRTLVEVRAPVSATIDENGRYAQARRGAHATATFTVERAGGRWRVSGVDDSFGLWLPRYEMQRAYSPLRISYVAAGSHRLVPDLRWVGGPREGLATALVRQLLAGPPDYLRGAVVSGAPAGTRLAVDAVPSTDAVAQVDLSSSVLSASPEQRQQLWAQLSTTLGQLPGVSAVQLTAGGTAIAVPGVDGPAIGGLGFEDDVKVAGEPIVLADARMVRLSSGTDTLVSGAGTSAQALPAGRGLRAVSAGPGGTPLVAVDGAGRRVVRLDADGTRRGLLTGASLIDPVVDLEGFVWSADQAASGRMRVVSGAGGADPPAVLAPQWLRGRTVRSVDLSREGARIAVVSSSPDGSRRLDVAGVVRGPEGRPASLSASPLEVAQSLTDVQDVAWADRTNLAVLGRGADGALGPFQVAVGGDVTAMPPVERATSIAVGDGLRAVYVTTAAGQVLSRSGGGWRTLGPGRSVTVPQ